MSSSETVQLPTYFADHAFTHYRRIAEGIAYDPSQLQAISDLAGESFGPNRHLLIEVDEIAFLYRFARPGFRQPVLDPPFHKAGPTTPYIPASELQLPLDAIPATITKGDMLRKHPGIFQVQVENPNDPPAVAFAKTLLYPPAEDLRLKASKFAWISQIADALDSRLSDANRRKFLARVTAEYTGAIMLQERPALPQQGQPK